MLDKFISSTSGKVAFNTFAQAAGKLATLIITLLITALITRSLGRGGYGNYSLARNFMFLFILGVDFGLNAIVVREIARRKGITQRYFENLLSLRLLLAVFFILFGIGLLPFFPYPIIIKWGAVIALLMLIPLGFYTSANTIFQTEFHYDLPVIALVLADLTVLVLIFLGTLKGWGLLFYLGAVLFGNVVLATTSFLFVRRFGVHFSLGKDWRLWRSLLLIALPLGLMLVFSQINAKADLFLLSLLPLPTKFGLGSSETVGVYSLAYLIFNNAIILPTFFMNAFFPIMVVDHKEDWARFIHRLRKVILVLLGLSILGLLIGFVLASWIVKLIAGKGFEHSVVALRILLLGLPLFYLSSPLQWFLVTVGKERVLPFIYGAAALVSVLLNLVLIPKFSYQASAVIVLITEGLILTLLVGFSRGVFMASRSK